MVVCEQQSGLAGAPGKVLVAETQRVEVVLPEQDGVTAAVRFGAQWVHDQKIALEVRGSITQLFSPTS